MLAPGIAGSRGKKRMEQTRILIVEDQADIRRLIRWALEDSDYMLHEAASGELALQLLPVLTPDLVLLDVMMPGNADGYEVCRQIRANPALTKTRVMMLTAQARSSDQDKAIAAGADAFLAKPFSPAKLIELVEELLGKAR
jgi:CheY-like chemotaxis protein